MHVRRIPGGAVNAFRRQIWPPQVSAWQFADDGRIPNNPTLPLLIYRNAVALPERDPATAFERVFTANDWPAAWRYGIFTFHHYHSTAHEVLGVYRGNASVQFGGHAGTVLAVGPGDVIVIPAGVGHKALESSPDFSVVGAYPAGSSADLLRGDPSERPRSLLAIAGLPLPVRDPVYGFDGPLGEHWRSRTGDRSGVDHPWDLG